MSQIGLLTRRGKFCKRAERYAVPVAQLDRVSASDAEGCEFEPRRVRQ